MACRLNNDQVLDLYADLQIEIETGLNNPDLPAFDLKSYIKDLYNDLIDPEDVDSFDKASIYAQAVPDLLLSLVKKERPILDYLRKTGLTTDDIFDLSDAFENINEVKKYVKSAKISNEYIEASIKAANIAKGRIQLFNPNDDMVSEILSWSENQDGTKPVTAFVTTGQEFMPIKPNEDLTEEERNERLDPDKIMFYKVIRDLVNIARARKTSSDQVVYQDTPIVLKVMQAQELDPKYYDRDTRNKIADNPIINGTPFRKLHREGIISVVSDTDGNMLFFDEEGNIVPEGKGRPIYQNIRKVVEKNGKLILSNYANYSYTLVTPEQIANNKKKNAELAGIDFTDEQYNNIVKQERARQKAEVNTLFKLRQHVLEDVDNTVLLPINGGSFGIVGDKFVNMSRTSISAKDITELYTDNVKDGGMTYFYLKNGDTDSKIYLQRSNMPDEVIEKIAEILTTTATYRGRQLSPKQRRDYAKIFLGPTPALQGYTVTPIDVYTINVDGQEILSIKIDGLVIDPAEEGAKEFIIDSLKNAIKGKTKTFSAILNYNDEYLNKDYTDYVIEGDKVTPVEKDYFNFIKDYIQILYTPESAAIIKGKNAYLSFSVPEDAFGIEETSEEPEKKSIIAETEEDEDTEEVLSKIKFTENTVAGYPAAAEKNIIKSDITLAFAPNFDTPSQAVAQKFADKHEKDYFGQVIKKTGTKLSLSPAALKVLTQQVSNASGGVINITGSDITELKGMPQELLNNFMYETLKYVKANAEIDIDHILTTGQSGIAQAATMAASRLGIPVSVLAPKGWLFKQPTKIKGKTVSDRRGEKDFKSRYGKLKKTTTTPTKTKEELSEQDIKILSAQSIDDILGLGFERSKTLNSFMDRIFTTKADLDKANQWWESTFGGLVPLYRITAIVNSNAFGTFTKAGVTLYEADGGTPIDLYHEAWHAFSQLFLTVEEKTDLYNHMRTFPKWEKASFEAIEEDIAEDFRSFMKFKKKFPGILGRIFEKIGKFLRKMFSGITRKDLTRPRDIARIRAMFDNLYKGELLDLKPNTDNIMPEFTKLNRLKTIKPLSILDQAPDTFTIDESEEISNNIDSLLAATFIKYNQAKNTTSGVARILHNSNNREQAYKNVKAAFTVRRDELREQYENIVIQNVNSETPDFDTENELLSAYTLLDKAVNNFGDVTKALNGKSKSGVIAYNLERTRFNILKDTFLELAEDPAQMGESQKLIEAQSGNIKSSKDLASEDTLMLISSIFKLEKDEKGNYNRVKTKFGFDKLESKDIIWNKLARTLEGSYTNRDIYNKLIEYSENYPEFQQILDMLPSPAENYSDPTEFSTETKFWQDFKKPRIPYVQLNINKKVLKDGSADEFGFKSKEEAEFSSAIANASFDVYRIINTWKNEFKNMNPDINPYIEKDRLSRNMLDTELLIDEFRSGKGLDENKAVAFLDALGIVLDTTSAEIKAITDKKSFARTFGVDYIFSIIKTVNKAGKSTDDKKVAAAIDFKLNPVEYLTKGLPEVLRDDIDNPEDVAARLRVLAEIQNKFSDSFANFSVLTPEGNRVFEHFLDSTLTRSIGAINKALNLKVLIDPEFDVNKEYIHMRWLADENNPYIKYSKLMNSVFYMDQLSDKYGQKRTVSLDEAKQKNKLNVRNVSGTKLVAEDRLDGEGVSTSSADATTKFIQEMNTMMLRGIQEFMRHASKQMAQGLIATKVLTYPGKKTDYLYIDIDAFKRSKGGEGETEGFDIILGYIAGELERINRFKNNVNDPTITGANKMSNWAGYNRKVRTKSGAIKMAGEVFTAFDDVISEENKAKLYALDTDLMTAIQEDQTLYDDLKEDVDAYFQNQTEKNAAKLADARYVDESLFEKVAEEGMTRRQVDMQLVKAYTYNSWIHNFETIMLTYGDLAQYNHAKEEFHKRNAGMTAPGRGFRADIDARRFINSAQFKRYYADKEGYTVRNYDGTLHTAILKEKYIDSKYYDEYKDVLKKDILERLKGNRTMTKAEKEKYAEKLADTEIDAYTKMQEADGQGHITFESYRMLKYAEGNWSDAQEDLYRKIANGTKVSVSDILEFFPPYKLQYFGNIQSTGLAVTSFHKFSLAPLIPSVIKNTKLEKLHDKMMTEQIDYAVHESGSKIAHITNNPEGEGDNIFNEDGSLNDNKFTPNVIFVDFLKNQTEINKEYKQKSIFSTQLRKLILEGLYEQGKIQSPDPAQQTDEKVKRYINDVSEYSELLKLELLDQIGYEQEGSGEDVRYIPTSKSSTEKLAKMLREELERDDTLGDHLIDFIDVLDTGEIVTDLSLHPEAGKIEKLLLSVINRKLIKQKVYGEPLVQVSGAMYEGVFGDMMEQFTPKTAKEKDAIVKKYVGTNFLPTYHKKADGSTAAMKVMVALQGNFDNLLLRTDLDGEVIGTVERLNDLIKDDKWLDTGDNRKAVTMVAVRIPVQGLNSMEFMEVYHFLPPEAGNIIVPPAEIVAKSGADFDIDKLTTFMPNINEAGEYVSKQFKDNSELEAAIKEAKSNGESYSKMIKTQKAAMENQLLEDIRNILELPQNYASLIRPNGTYLLKDIADDLSKYVSEYDPYENTDKEVFNYDEKKSNKKVISPTRVLESGYNIFKHESNVVGKKTLGLGAVENTFNVIFNSLGASMPAQYLHGDDEDLRNMVLLLRHNKKKNSKGEEVISLSNRYDVDGVNKIADIFSQAINGWVDVEKDAWIFFIQGNYEVASTLLYLVKTGVPVEEAIYFVSQPLVREYVKEQRLGNSAFAEVLGKDSDAKTKIKSDAAKRVMKKYFGTTYKSGKIYSARERLQEDLNVDTFNKEEMYDLIKDSAKDMDKAKSDLSKLMFLHFLEIEQQITGIKQLKLNSNPDTSLKSTYSDVEQSEANLETIKDNTKIDEDLKNDIRYDSITSSFFNNSLALAIIEPLMPLRYHPRISDYIITNMADFNDYLESTFGYGKKSQMIDTFRNDLVSVLLQNALRKYNIKDTYKGYKATSEVPTKLVDKLEFGAYVQEDASGQPILYIDKKQLDMQFRYGLWEEGSDYEGSYEDLGLYPLDSNYFKENESTNISEYYAFVAEREYLRHITPIATVADTKQFKAELKNVKRENKKMAPEKAVRYTYEKMLAMRALDNVYNPYKLFKDPNEAFAVKVNEIIKEFPNLKVNYPILERLLVDTNKKETIFNLYVNEKDFSNSVSNLYYKNLMDLADPKVIKTTNQEDNERISEMFSRLPLVSLLQAGLNKSKWYFNNIVNLDSFVELMDQERNNFLELMKDEQKANNLLDKFFEAFVEQNDVTNVERTRFKDYFFANSLEEATGKTEERVKLTKTNNPNIFMFAEGKGTIEHFKKIADSNQDVVFFHTVVQSQIGNPSLHFNGMPRLREVATGMTIEIPISNSTIDDNFSSVNKKDYPAIKANFEKALTAAQKRLAKNGKIALSRKGYGDPEVMPKELFVYLSKRLYEVFNYVNPGSTMYTEVKDVIRKNQGISDDDIQAAFELENDPFKCKI